MLLPVDPAKYSAFFLAMALLAATPGPAVLVCIRAGLSGRRAEVLAAVAGNNAAMIVWYIAAASGLQLLFAAFPLAFHIIAVLGGFYIGWLGFGTILKARKLDSQSLDLPPPEPKSSLKARFTSAFMVQILNPKFMLMFTAVLPPFIDTGRAFLPQMLVFAATTLGLDFVFMTSYGLAAHRLTNILSQPRHKQRFDLLVGGLLLLIAGLIIVHGLFDLLAPLMRM
jgi:threonine/homoserine/homoserine lactone efflux protein